MNEPITCDIIHLIMKISPGHKKMAIRQTLLCFILKLLIYNIFLVNIVEITPELSDSELFCSSLVHIHIFAHLIYFDLYFILVIMDHTGNYTGVNEHYMGRPVDIPSFDPPGYKGRFDPHYIIWRLF